jgi:hypothetical protein
LPSLVYHPPEIKDAETEDADSSIYYIEEEEKEDCGGGMRREGKEGGMAGEEESWYESESRASSASQDHPRTPDSYSYAAGTHSQKSSI